VFVAQAFDPDGLLTWTQWGTRVSVVAEQVSDDNFDRTCVVVSHRSRIYSCALGAGPVGILATQVRR